MTEDALTDPRSATPVHDRLKQTQRRLRGGFPETLGLRVHRAISWIGRAEREEADDDARFVFLWIAFNAAYAEERAPEETERDAFRRFFERIVARDGEGRVQEAVWTRFPHEIRVMLDNRFVFHPFWAHYNGLPGYDDWEDRFAAAKIRALRALAARDTATVLSVIFDRLYTLRNQIVHGGATWGGRVNRAQLRDGAAILWTLLPRFVEIMMADPDADWGAPFYPVVED